jgi:shikimate kinase
MAIPMIFERHGETHFRELEIEVARSLRKRSNVVIATGGGMVINNLCIQYLTENKGRVLYLESSFREISERVSSLGANISPFFSFGAYRSFFIPCGLSLP